MIWKDRFHIDQFLKPTGHSMSLDEGGSHVE